jgi:hypothetical protein
MASRFEERRLTYYVIITGKDKDVIGYMWFKQKEKVFAWTKVGEYRQSLAVQHDGVNFSVYDELPFATNEQLAMVFEQIIDTVL